jgi:hypothetical protein
LLDQNKDLKTRERWSQLHMSTIQILNTVLRDRQIRRLGEEAQRDRRIQTR